MQRSDRSLGSLLGRMNGVCLPGLIHWALLWVLQEHFPNDTGVNEVHKVDQGSGYLKRKLQVRQGSPRVWIESPFRLPAQLIP